MNPFILVQRVGRYICCIDCVRKYNKLFTVTQPKGVRPSGPVYILSYLLLYHGLLVT